ncbi:hypothetical protein ABKV19_022613 [Rosa sericea]
MEATVAPSSIVLELLNENNYEEWSVWVKTYLVAHDLWDIVETGGDLPEPSQLFKNLRRKNAQALHAIQISCGLDAFSLIKNVTTAKEAWDTLLTAKQQQNSSRPQGFLYDPGFGSDTSNFDEYEPFFEAVKGDLWEKAQELLKMHPDAIRARKPYSGKTALHIATDAGHPNIVEQLVHLMPEEYLEIRGDDGMTALAAAANKGFTRMAKCMVWKNKRILSIGDASNRIPLVLAYRMGHLNMARYLYCVTPREDLMPETGPNGATIVSECFIERKFDIAWALIQRFPRLAISRDHYDITPLYALSGVPSAFLSGMKLRFWQRWIYNCIKIQRAPLAANDIYINVGNMENNEGNRRDFRSGICHILLEKLLSILGISHLQNMKLIHTRSSEFLDHMCETIKHLDRSELQTAGVNKAIFQAVERGISEFITKILTTRPELVRRTNEKNRSIFHVAVEYRQEKIYNLIYGLSTKDVFATHVDTSNNNMLHMAAMLPPSEQLNGITGAALKMQRELQWFKEVERIVPSQYREKMNHTDCKRPGDLFTIHHKKLVEEGEKWMKDTARSCSVVGALIVTIMFAAAFTVPGGNNQNSGIPIFINDKIFSLFIISDAISLFSSTTASLMFLEIMTSRYAEEDFLKSLPKKMLIGLFSLFLSIATMMLAFCAALLIMLKGKPWTVFPVISLASVPVSLFVCMKFPLFIEICSNTYRSRSRVFNRDVKPWL